MSTIEKYVIKLNEIESTLIEAWNLWYQVEPYQLKRNTEILKRLSIEIREDKQILSLLENVKESAYKEYGKRSLLYNKAVYLIQLTERILVKLEDLYGKSI